MRKPKFSKKFLYTLTVITLLLFFILAFQGSRGLWEPDEGRYANIALNMIKSGNYLVPYINDETPHFTKPPFIYWAIAASIKLFGRNEWAIRLPNAIAFFGTTIFIYLMGLHLVRLKPWLPPLVYATSTFPYVALNIVTTDTLLTFWESLAVMGFLYARWNLQSSKKRIYYDIMWLGFGFAFLTKGPPGLLPLLAIFIYIIIIDGFGGLRQMVTWEGLLGFLSIGFIWYFLMIAQYPKLFTFFFQNEFLTRIATGTHKRNYEWYAPFLIYLPLILFGSFPWIIAMTKPIRKLPIFLQKKYWLDKNKQEPDVIFLILWVLLPLSILCFAKSRLPLYILPLFVPLSIIIAREIQSVIDLKENRMRIALVSWIILMLTAKYTLSVIPYNRDSRALAESIKQQVKEPMEDILFVDKMPYYGLTLYLNMDIERLTIYNETPGGHTIKEEELLTEEISELSHEKKFLFIVPKYNLCAFKNAITNLKYKFRPAGYWNHLFFFYLSKN